MKFVNSPFNYTGNKFKLLPQIEKYIPDNCDCMLDLFCGSGAVGVNFSPYFSKVYLNDRLQDLINLHKVILSLKDLELFVQSVQKYSKKDYKEYQVIRDRYNKSTSAFDRALMFYGLMTSCTNNMIRFNKSGKFNQTCGRRSFNFKSEEKLRNWIEKLKENKHKLYFKSFDFRQALTRLNRDRSWFVYADPPYSNTLAGYNTQWSVQDDRDLFTNILKTRNNVRWMISSSKIHGEKKSILVEHLIDIGFDQVILDCDYDKVGKKKKHTEEVLLVNYR